MTSIKFWLVLLTTFVASAGELRLLSIGVEPDLLAHGKLDIYAHDAEFVAQAFEKTKPLSIPQKSHF